MSYLTLEEAAQYATKEKGFHVEPAALLRAGVHGTLLLCASFDGPIRNLTKHANEFYAGLLVISRLDILRIETQSHGKIEGAFSLDGKTAYSPQVTRIRDQLRVMVVHLNNFLPLLIDETEKTDTPADKGGVPNRGIAKSAVINAFEPMHLDHAGWSKALANVPKWLEPCRVMRGRKGDSSTSATWNPVLIAVALYDKKIPIKKLDAVFVHLNDWADEWRTASEALRD